MSSLITNATIQIRQDTAGNWTSTNPTPAAGEWCLEIDTKYIKIGDGSTEWTSLGYQPNPAEVAAKVTGSRDSQDWVEFTGDWQNKEFIVTPAGAIGYSNINDVYDLLIDIWLADDDTPTNPVKLVTWTKIFDQTSPSNLSIIRGLSIQPNNSSSFKLQTGADGAVFMLEDGTERQLTGASTGAFKVIITRLFINE